MDMKVWPVLFLSPSLFLVIPCSLRDGVGQRVVSRDICEPGEFAGSGEDKRQKVTGAGQALLHYCQHGLLVFHIGRDLYRVTSSQ